MKMKRLARFTGRGKNKKKEQKEAFSPKISSPVIEERKPKISSPVIEERKPKISSPVIEERKPKISSPVIEERKPKISSPVIEERKPNISSPVIEERKEQKSNVVVSPKISPPVIEQKSHVVVSPKISSPVIEQKSHVVVSPQISSPVIDKTEEQSCTVSKTTVTLTNSAPPAKRDQKPTYVEETIIPPPRTYPAGIVEPCHGLVIENPYENHDLIEEHQVMNSIHYK